MITKDETVLFQGDSFTDCGRDRDQTDPNNFAGLGHGYAFHAAAMLLNDQPGGSLRVLNRGIGGDKIWQLQERWRADCIDLKPTVVSILIGVNDTAHGLRDRAQRVTLDHYEAIYRELLTDTAKALPSVRFILCEPFVLRCGGVTDEWFPEFDQRRAVVKRVADDAGAVFVPFQSIFDEAATLAPPSHWAPDGVHPSLAGHLRMARTWIKAAC